ncbi:HNH endonuclease family protein [Corynebacterium choanae]
MGDTPPPVIPPPLVTEDAAQTQQQSASSPTGTPPSASPDPAQPSTVGRPDFTADTNNSAPPGNDSELAGVDVTVQLPADYDPTQWPNYQLIASPVEATQLLATLPIRGRSPKTGYSRQAFGDRWTDDVTVEFGHNGCDTRNDILRRDLSQVVTKPGTRDCVVLSGDFLEPYTGTPLHFQRGKDTSPLVQIDHVVALGDAWQKGAQQLAPEQRQNFANDPDNLLAVMGRVNTQKSASDAASWQPPNTAFRCAYAIRQIVVKHRYALWVTQAEHDALAASLQRCPS